MAAFAVLISFLTIVDILNLGDMFSWQNVDASAAAEWKLIESFNFRSTSGFFLYQHLLFISSFVSVASLSPAQTGALSCLVKQLTLRTVML